MVGAAWSGAHDADLALVLLIDARPRPPRGRGGDSCDPCPMLKGARPAVYVALNKVDRLGEKAASCWRLPATLQEALPASTETFLISALERHGLSPT
jgi:GTPase Era involved in 16S rRNA processing